MTSTLMQLTLAVRASRDAGFDTECPDKSEYDGRNSLITLSLSHLVGALLYLLHLVV